MQLLLTCLLFAGLAAASPDAEALRAIIQPKADLIVDATIPALAPLLNFLVLSRAGQVLYKRTAGTRQLGSAEPLGFNDLFWLASHTKILGAMALLKTVSMGLIGLDDSVLELLPGLAREQVRTDPNDPASPTRPREGDITVRQLLTFTAGCAYPVVEHLATLAPEAVLTDPSPFFVSDARVYEGSHATDPGKEWRYGAEADYAGLLVEKLAGKSLGAFVQAELLAPAGVDAADFTFRPDAAQQARLVGQHVKAPGIGVVPRPPIYDHAGMQFESAGAGGFGTIGALAQALLPLVNQGRHPVTGKQVLPPAIVAEMFRPQLSAAEMADGLDAPSQAAPGGGVLFPGVPKQWGLGALLFPRGFEQTGRGAGTLAWAGFSNVNWHCDAEKGIVVLAWTQMIPQDDPAFNEQTRFPIEKIVYDAIGDDYF